MLRVHLYSASQALGSLVPKLLESPRPRQRLKNAFGSIPLTFDRKLRDPSNVTNSFVALELLRAMSRSVCLMNDLSDMDAARHHPINKCRPLASGRLSTHVALLFSAVFAISSLGIGFKSTWERTARETLAVYEKVLAESS